MAKLDDYRRKRKEGATNEPFGDDAIPSAASAGATQADALTGAFVVHLHDATARHFDVRLEVAGVLASFAVPRGPSLDPEVKHLAMRTEDHPLEYLDFEDVVPDGQYGAGPMIAWDRGTVEYLEGPADEEIARGKLHVRLHGHKLRGAWALVKLKKSARDEWLFFKKQDEHADRARDVVRELPRSVLSGLAVEELAERDAIARAREAEARAAGAEERRAGASLALARAASAGAQAPGSVVDAELGGVRVLATRDGEVVTLHAASSSGAPEPIEAFYPDVVRALRALPTPQLVLDGTLVAWDPSGHPSVTRLAERAARLGRAADPAEATRVVFGTPVALVTCDVLALGALDLRSCPLEARRALLGRLLPAPGVLRAAPPLVGELASVRASCAALGVEAVVCKPAGSRYGEGWVRSLTGIAAGPRVAVDHGAGDPRAPRRHVAVTNPAKIFWPEEGITKRDLCDYYVAVADVMLPYLHARPVILVRYPDGIAGKSFFQWNVPAGMPPWIRTLTFEADAADGAEAGAGGKVRRGFFVDDEATLLYVTNLGNIPLHILGSRTPELAKADFFVLDFDVKQSELRHAVTLARTLRSLLDEVGLVGFPKTSGQTGLHVLCPLGPGHGWETARALCELLGRVLVARHPDLATMERAIGRRGAKVYVDTGQTGPSRAIVAPYSVRAVAGATVSTPLSWDEVEPALDPRAFTLRSVPDRVAARGDPMAPLLTARPDVAAAVTRLAALLGRA
jgi:bifunctional non-homologous end joining protein LigD